MSKIKYSFRGKKWLRILITAIVCFLVVGLVGGILVAMGSSYKITSSKMSSTSVISSTSSSSGSGSSNSGSTVSDNPGSDVSGGDSEPNSSESGSGSSSSDVSGLLPLPEGSGDYVQIDNRDGQIEVLVVRVDENGDYENEEDRYVVLETILPGGSYYFDPAREDEYYYLFQLVTIPESYDIEYRGVVDGNNFVSFEDCVVGDDYVDTLICYPDDGGSSWYFSNHDCGYLRITTTLH